MMPNRFGLLLSCFDYSTVAADEFHDWYDMEHIPERKRVPGFLQCERWLAVDRPNASIATYDLERFDVLRSPAYLAIGYENNSPWTRRVGWRCVKLLRAEAEQVAPGDALPPKDAAALFVWAFNLDGVTEEALIDWYRGTYLPNVRNASGVESARLFRSNMSTHRFAALIHLSHPDIVQTQHWREYVEEPWRERFGSHERDRFRILAKRYVRSDSSNGAVDGPGTQHVAQAPHLQRQKQTFSIEALHFDYCNPSHRIVFGRGAITRVAQELAAISAHAPMLVCSARGATSAAGRLIIERLKLPRDAVFDRVEPHAPVKSVDEAWKRACAIQPDCFVALGGGSAMDTTKGIALACAESGRVMDFVLERALDGRLIGRQSSKPKRPIVAIPTTLSGAEVSPSFALTDDTARKVIIRDNGVAPSILVYDPDLMRSMPLHTMAPSAMNALAHTVEALYSKARNPISEMFASEGLQLLHRGLSMAIADAEDPDAYVRLTLGAYYAAAAIVNARTALHHAICHKLAPAAALSHGTANSIILPHALRFNLAAARPQLERVARLICTGDRAHAELGAEDAIAALEELCARARLPRRLRDAGVSPEIFAPLADKIFREPGLAFNPRELTSVQEIEDVLRAAW